MAHDVLMPKMGYDMEEGKILRWLKQEGEAVTKGQPIAEIETDKIAIEIEAFASGVLTKILVPAGEMAPVGSAIGLIGQPGEKTAAPPPKDEKAAPGRSDKAAPDAAAVAKPTKPVLDEGTEANSGASPAIPAPDATAELTAAAPQKPEAASASKTEAAASANKTEAAAPLSKTDAPTSGERVKASPLARKMALDKGIELTKLTGSGPGGRIVKKDVEGAESAAPEAAAPSATEATTQVAAGVPGQAALAGVGRRVPLSGMRKAIARRMAESKAPVPHFYVTMAVDMDAAMALRTQINGSLEKDDKISVNDFIIKACALALRKHQSLNAVFAGDAIVYPDEIAISVAVAIDEGLIAPDIHRADEKSIGTIAREVKDKARRAKEGKLTPDEYGRGTFTVSNLGMFGVEAFTAIITLPQSAAIAVGAMQREPVVRNDQVVPGQIMRFTVSADHRVTDGAGSAQFAAEVKRLLENPLQLLL
jgi:pyruvate dehydrogenase E2 component (dihydrolipoamide acetyltransferase)